MAFQVNEEAVSVMRDLAKKFPILLKDFYKQIRKC